MQRPFRVGRNSVYPFLARGAFFLPLCIGLWYWQAEWFNAPAALLSKWIIQWLFDDWVRSVEWSGRVLTVITNIDLPAVAVPAERSGQVATAVAQTNTLLFGFGLPLFAALILAGADKGSSRKLLSGALILVPVQGWGIVFAILRQVAYLGGPAVSAKAGFSPWQIDGILVGAQLGYLILPSVAPIALWLAFNRHVIPILMLEDDVQRRNPRQ